MKERRLHAASRSEAEKIAKANPGVMVSYDYVERRRRSRTGRERLGFLRRDLTGVSRGTVIVLVLAVLGVVCVAFAVWR